MIELPHVIGRDGYLRFVCPCGYKMLLADGHNSVVCRGLCGNRFRVQFDGSEAKVELYSDCVPGTVLSKFLDVGLPELLEMTERDGND